MIVQLLIPAIEVTGQGVIDEMGNVGETNFIVPSMSLPQNFQKVEVKKFPDGSLVYVVSFDDGKLPEVALPEESQGEEYQPLQVPNMQP